MEAKLQSLKVADLKALLTSAGLAVSGNKPDLIQRLLENPSATASLGGTTETSAPAPAAPAVSTPTPAPAAAPSPAAPAAPSAPAPTEPAASTGPSEEARRQALIVELEKRKARAAKFGTTLGEAERKLERAIKFGLDPEDEANVAKLTQPLGSKPAKGEGRKDVKKQEAEKESEEEKQARLKRVEEEKEKARKRAERFGLTTEVEGEGKRKREENREAGEKKVKT